MSVDEALRIAREASLDLVEVAPDGSPPVCKIMDYGKHKYKMKKGQQQTSKKQHVSQIKGIRLLPGTDVHDLEHKARHARGFLEHNHKVQVQVRFFGRWMAHVDLGKEVMMKFCAMLEDAAKIEQEPRLDGRRMTMMLAPLPKIKSKSKPKSKPQPEETATPEQTESTDA